MQSNLYTGEGLLYENYMRGRSMQKSDCINISISCPITITITNTITEEDDDELRPLFVKAF